MTEEMLHFKIMYQVSWLLSFLVVLYLVFFDSLTVQLNFSFFHLWVTCRLHQFGAFVMCINSEHLTLGCHIFWYAVWWFMWQWWAVLFVITSDKWQEIPFPPPHCFHTQILRLKSFACSAVALVICVVCLYINLFILLFNYYPCSTLSQTRSKNSWITYVINDCTGTTMYFAQPN